MVTSQQAHASATQDVNLPPLIQPQTWGPLSLHFETENQPMLFFTNITCPPTPQEVTSLSLPLQLFVCDGRGTDEIWEGVNRNHFSQEGKAPNISPGMPPYHLAQLLSKEEGQPTGGFDDK